MIWNISVNYNAVCWPCENQFNFTINQRHFKSSQKLIKHFHGTIFSIWSILPSLSVWPVIFVLNLNESVSSVPLKPIILPSWYTAAISLKYYQSFQMFLNNYRYILLSYTLAMYSKFRWLIRCTIQQIFYFLVFHYYVIIPVSYH